MIVTAKTDEDWEIFCKFAQYRGHYQYTKKPLDMQVLGAMKDGRLIAILEFQFMRRTCHVHVLGKVTPDLTRAMFKYAFEDNKIVQIFGAPSCNSPLVRFLHNLGFKELCRIKGGWDEITDVILMGMHVSECRFVKEK